MLLRSPSWRPLAVGGLALALVAASCGGSSSAGGDARRAGSQPDPVPPSTTAVTDVTPPVVDAGEPVRVLMAGDSVMEGVAPAVEAAYGPDVDVRFVLSPQLIRDEAQRVIWQATLDEDDPDVIVLLVSHWERLLLGVQTADRFPPMEEYLTMTVDPFIDVVTSAGATLLWLEAPYVADARRSAIYALQNQAYATAAGRRDEADYLATNDLVGGPGGAYTDILMAADGTPIRMRDTDGDHLCPDGAARVAQRIVTRIGQEHAVQPVDGWQSGPWRNEPPFDDPEACPPA